MKPKVDRAARRKAAQTLRDFIAGRIDNFAFEEAEPLTDDPVVGAIWDSCWLLYDDFKRHRLTGRHALSLDTRRQMLRWVLFLDTDLPYLWPNLPFAGWDPRVRVRQSGWRGWLTGGLSLSVVQGFLAKGHYPVWPFRSVMEFKHALATPRRLSGQRSALG